MEFYESGNKATCVCSYYDVIAVDSEIWFSYCCFSYEMKHVLFYGGGSLHFDGSTKCGEILVILLFRDEKRVFLRGGSLHFCSSYERDRIGAW